MKWKCDDMYMKNLDKLERHFYVKKILPNLSRRIQGVAAKIKRVSSMQFLYNLV